MYQKTLFRMKSVGPKGGNVPPLDGFVEKS